MTRYSTTKSISIFFSFLALASLSTACPTRIKQSETKANGDAWCTSIYAVVAGILDRCHLGKETESICSQISELPKGVNCSIFRYFIKDLTPTKRITLLKHFSPMERASMSKDLEFLIPEDVRPRLTETSYVDAYIRAVERIETLKIPDFSSEIANFHGPTVGLGDGRVVFGTMDRLTVMDFKSGKENLTFDTTNGHFASAMFIWSHQLCTISLIELPSPSTSIDCYSNPPATKDQRLTNKLSFSLPPLRIERPFIKVVNDQVYLVEGLWSENINVCQLDMKQQNIDCKIINSFDHLVYDYIMINPQLKVYKHKNFFSEFPPLYLPGGNHPHLTAVPLLEDLYVGSTLKGFIAVERQKDGTFKVLKESPFSQNYLNCHRSYRHYVQKLTGGLVIFNTHIPPPDTIFESNGGIPMHKERLLDIWATDK